MAIELRSKPESGFPFERMDVAELLHELGVRQIELEIQNEELRESQLALTEARDRYSRLYEFAPVGYLSLDRAGVITAANLTATSLFNIDRGSLVGRRLAEFVAPECQDDLHQHLLAVYSRPFKQACDLTMKHVRGKPLHVRIESIADEMDNEVRGCSTTLTDITQLQQTRLALGRLNDSLEAQVVSRTKALSRANADLESEILRAEAAAAELARTNEFNRTLLDTAQTIVLVLDKNARIVYFNRYFEILTGYSLAEVRGEDWFATFIPERHHAWLRGLFKRSESGVAPASNVNPIVSKQGEEREIQWYNAALKTSDGQLQGLLCSGQDVTETKTLQERLLTVAEQEQQRIGEQLHDDLGQELAALKVNMDMMVEGLEAAGSAELQRAIRITDGLISALRKVRQLAHGLVPYRVSAGNFAAELGSLCNAFADVDCTCECDPLCVPGSDQVASQLYYIAREAVINAVKHGRREDLKVAISCRRIDGQYVVSVADNGPGITEEDWRAGGSGLHIMHHRAELIDGMLSVECPPGGGTVLRCTVPAELVEE